MKRTIRIALSAFLAVALLLLSACATESPPEQQETDTGIETDQTPDSSTETTKSVELPEPESRPAISEGIKDAYNLSVGKVGTALLNAASLDRDGTERLWNAAGRLITRIQQTGNASEMTALADLSEPLLTGIALHPELVDQLNGIADRIAGKISGHPDVSAVGVSWLSAYSSAPDAGETIADVATGMMERLTSDTLTPEQKQSVSDVAGIWLLALAGHPDDASEFEELATECLDAALKDPSRSAALTEVLSIGLSARGARPAIKDTLDGILKEAVGQITSAPDEAASSAASALAAGTLRTIMAYPEKVEEINQAATDCILSGDSNANAVVAKLSGPYLSAVIQSPDIRDTLKEIVSVLSSAAGKEYEVSPAASIGTIWMSSLSSRPEMEEDFRYAANKTIEAIKEAQEEDVGALSSFGSSWIRAYMSLPDNAELVKDTGEELLACMAEHSYDPDVVAVASSTMTAVARQPVLAESLTGVAEDGIDQISAEEEEERRKAYVDLYTSTLSALAMPSADTSSIATYALYTINLVGEHSAPSAIGRIASRLVDVLSRNADLLDYVGVVYERTFTDLEGVGSTRGSAIATLGEAWLDTVRAVNKSTANMETAYALALDKLPMQPCDAFAKAVSEPGAALINAAAYTGKFNDLCTLLERVYATLSV